MYPRAYSLVKVAVVLHVLMWFHLFQDCIGESVSDLIKAKSMAISALNEGSVVIPVSYQRGESLSKRNKGAGNAESHKTLQIESKSREIVGRAMSNHIFAGQFLMPIQMGSPPQDALVTLDTGSGFLWLQCQPCDECGFQFIPSIFDPSTSKSYSVVSCSSSNCSIAPFSYCDRTRDTCLYNSSYVDKSFSEGKVSMDTLTISATSGYHTSIMNFVYGCGHKNVGVETQTGASGMMGLNRNPLSFVSQVNVPVFSYCLPERTSNSSGLVVFGHSGMSTQCRYTPMIQNNASPDLSQFYYINITGITVGDEYLPIPKAVFELGDGGQGGSYIDSGKTLTSLVEPAYTLLRDAFRNKTAHLRKAPSNELFDTCYSISANDTWPPPSIPTITFHLANDLNIDLQAEHVLISFSDHDTLSGVLCLAFLSAGTIEEGNGNGFGNHQQQNLMIEYDIANSRLGFAPAKCAIE